MAKRKAPKPRRLYRVKVSGNAYVTTTYEVKASSPAEAETLVRAGEGGCKCVDEEITDRQDTEVEVEEWPPRED